MLSLVLTNDHQNAVFVPIIYFCFPETANKSLEEIDHVFLKRERLTSDEQQWLDSRITTASTEVSDVYKDKEIPVELRSIV